MTRTFENHLQLRKAHRYVGILLGQFMLPLGLPKSKLAHCAMRDVQRTTSDEWPCLKEQLRWAHIIEKVRYGDLQTSLWARLLFDPLGPVEKHSESWLFYLFAHLHLLSSDSFSSLIFSLLLFSSLLSSPLLWLFPPLLFHLSILSSLTSKLSLTNFSSLLYFSRLYSTQHLPLLNFYSTATSTYTPNPLLLSSTLLSSTLLCSALRYSALLYSSRVFSTLRSFTLL